jgi:hypothetical protein
VLGYRLDDQEFESWQGLGIFLFTTTSRPALGPTQPPIQWALSALSPGVKLLSCRCMKLTTHLHHLALRSIMCGAIPPLPIHLHGVVFKLSTGITFIFFDNSN